MVSTSVAILKIKNNKSENQETGAMLRILGSDSQRVNKHDNKI